MILEEDLGSNSEGSTSIAISYSTIPRSFGGELFMVSHDSVAQDRETSAPHGAHKGNNADHTQRCLEEADAANAADGNLANVGGNPCPFVQNLDQEFFHIGNQDIEQTPSANLAVAAHELGKLQQTPEIIKVRALLRAAQVQVNELRNNQAPTHSTALNHHRSVGRHPSHSQRAGGSHVSLACHQGDG